MGHHLNSVGLLKPELLDHFQGLGVLVERVSGWGGALLHDGPRQ